MSHQPERKEKDCLNCGNEIAGRFCHVCGQENVLPKQKFWGLITHFVYDVLHFDGKFFKTLQLLLAKPGFIPKEYIQGKRQRYLEPVRMYLFTSAFFFLVFFAITDPEDSFKMNETGRIMSRHERFNHAQLANNHLVEYPSDLEWKSRLNYFLDTNYRISLNDTTKAIANDSSFIAIHEGRPYFITARKIPSQGLNIKSKSRWLENELNNKYIASKKKYADDNRAMYRDIVDTFLHKIPYILFISLPFFALILKFLYVRRKNFYYSDHAIFTLYHYIFTFIVLLIYFLLIKLNDWLEWDAIKYLAILIFLAPGIFLFFAMKRFYMQGTGKTILKFFLLNMLVFIVMTVIMILFILLSLITF